MGQLEANKHLNRARKQLERVQTASWDPEDQDREDAVTWAFYAYENGLVAVLEKKGLPWKPTHWDKLRAADAIHQKGLVLTNISARLVELNELRKDVQYEEAGPELLEYD